MPCPPTRVLRDVDREQRLWLVNGRHLRCFCYASTEAMRERDLDFEKLVEVTRSNPDFERGRLNAALASIRSCCDRDGIPRDDVAKEIEQRAAWYADAFPGLTLTPTALARHWYRVAPTKKESLIEKWEERFRDDGGS